VEHADLAKDATHAVELVEPRRCVTPESAPCEREEGALVREGAEEEGKAAELLNDVDGRRLCDSAKYPSLEQEIGHRNDLLVRNAGFADQIPQCRLAGSGAADELDDHESSR
jgi:hypothetical protein